MKMKLLFSILKSLRKWLRKWEELHGELGRDPTLSEMTNKLNLSVKQIKNIIDGKMNKKQNAILMGPFVGELYWECGRFAPMLPKFRKIYKSDKL